MANQVTTLRMGQKFKRTALGEIPIDWNLTTFGDSFDFLRTANNSRDDLESTGTVGYVHYGDIHTKWRTSLKCDGIDLPKISESKVVNVPRLQNGDLVIADASEDYAGVGVSVEAYGLRGSEVVAGLHTMLLRDKGGHFVDGFRGLIQYIPAVRHGLIRIATGGSVYGFSKGNLKGVQIPRPPLDEQRRIVEILSGIDDVIGRTDSIVACIEELKRGLLRQLLTRGLKGEKFKRNGASGFPASWEIRSLGDLAHVRYGLGQPPATDPHGVPMIRATNIWRDKIIPEGILRVDPSSLPVRRKPYLSEGEIIVVRSGANTGDVAIVTKPWVGAVAGYDLVVTPLKKIHPVYLFNYLRSERAQAYFGQQRGRSAQPHLNAEQVEQTPIAFPPLDEQRRISEILTEIDMALEYETSLSVATDKVRQTARQALLMGRIRFK